MRVTELARLLKPLILGWLPTREYWAPINELKGWPPSIQDYLAEDLAAANLWFDTVGTPTSAIEPAWTADEGITQTYKLCGKSVADGATEGWAQRWTYADEPRVKSGRPLSALLAIWSAGGISVTAKMVNSDASETAAPAVTAAAWTIVEIGGHALAGTYCDLRVTAGAAGTFYVAPLGVCLGNRGLWLPPRPVVWVAQEPFTAYSGDPGGAWQNVDITTEPAPLACRVHVVGQYYNNTTPNRALYARREGYTGSNGVLLACAPTVGATLTYGGGAAIVDTDDEQRFEVGTTAVAGDTEGANVQVIGRWDWA